ncbi:MAG: diguanylate cyclase (GGDEF)-like protein, partial [Chitinophagales bacterium]
DIDNFKLINDNYGHLVGDQVLILLSNAIGSTTGASNIAGRIGGDEFAILLPELGTDAGRSRAKQLAICFAQKIDTLGALVLKPTLSIGVEQYRHGDNDTKSVMFRADKALYRAKQNGRNCIVVTTNQYSQ